MGEAAAVLDFDALKTRRFLEDLRSESFVAAVVRSDGTVDFFEKGMGPSELAQVREALEANLSERTEDDGTTEA